MDDVLTRLKRVQEGLGLDTDDVLAEYLRVGVDDLQRARVNVAIYPLPPAGIKSLGVAWRYLLVSDAVLRVLPAAWRLWCRNWECKNARHLARQRALKR
ncbi:hypothetical protein [Ottowia sp.]|uniref:hypothetical protein n=1 Tax=Ottowia sp. TaxID=1898956 RepID=UPI0025FAEDE6|nr:hypothetical protein [Ottowia sp.]MBK6616385.1 hypothetical protein [Ottowia sp.]